MPNIINRKREIFAINETASAKAIVFIDSSVEDIESLVAGVEVGVEAIALSPLQNGVKQIAEILANRTNLNAIHIVSHGSPGSLQLGNTKLTLNNINAYITELQQWTDNSSPVSLLLYGCNVAAGALGKAFVQQLSNLTGTRVAASANKTGSAALGGDWELEVSTGEIQAKLAFKPEVMATYNAVFAEPKLEWIQDIGIPDTDDIASNVTVDSAGNVYISGSTLNKSAVKLMDRQFPYHNSWVAKYDSTGSQKWFKQVVKENELKTTDAIDDIAVDNSGNVYIAGYTTDGFPGTNGTNFDAWIAKYDSAGDQQWVKQLASNYSNGLSSPFSVTTDNIGNVYITGDINRNLDDPNTGGIYNWVAKYDSTGNQQWVKPLGSNNYEYPYDITTDSIGNVYITGYIDTSYLASPNNDGGIDAWVAKYDSNGNQQWLKQFNNAIYSKDQSIAVDITGNIYISGDATGAFVAKYDNSGNQLQFREFPVGEIESVFVDKLGNAYVTQQISGPIGYYSEVTKYDISGTKQWIKTLTGISSDVAVASAGEVYVANDDGIDGGKNNTGNPGDSDFAVVSEDGSLFKSKDYRHDTRLAKLNSDELFFIGTPGNDILSGGDGNDVFITYFGDDNLTGSNGNDVLFANQGADTLDGGTGDDTLCGGKDNDTLGDAIGNNYLNGNMGNDTVNGGAGNDTVHGGKDNDILNGGDSDDRLSGDLGDDTLTGGAGSDRFVLTPTKGPDLITDFADGSDRFELTDGLTFEQLTVTSGSNATLLNITSTGELLASLSAVQSNLIGVEDFIVSNETVNGGETNETLTGGNGDERLSGDYGANTLTGGAGSDRFVLTLTGPSNVVITDFSDGTDLLELTEGLTFEQLRITQSIDATLIIQGISYNQVLASLSGVQSNLIGVEDFIIRYDEQFFYGTPNSDVLYGSYGNDVFVTYEGDDNLFGSNGNDVLFANQGADALDGGTGDDTLCGGKDNDILADQIGNNYLNGNMGNDTVNGGEGNDTLHGGQDNDILNGGDGNDRLSGDFGNDTLTGGAGSDRFVLTPTKGDDIITDFADGSDRFELTDGLTFEQLTITSGTDATLINIISTGELLASLNGVPSNLIGIEDFIAV